MSDFTETQPAASEISETERISETETEISPNSISGALSAVVALLGNEVSEIKKDIAIFWHNDCLLHKIHGHPECPDRVAGILRALRGVYPEECFHEAPLATDNQILLFHTPQLLLKLKRLFETTENAFRKGDNEMMRISIDGDTNVMWRTRNAVYCAAGSVCAAVDALYRPIGDPLRVRSAFCCVRPPGHHAERGKAQGFCFFNNAGIAARYAQETYGVKKVAVLDFDVHHGNGTEEGFIPDDTLFYGSTHELEGYPNTGVDPSPFVGDLAKQAIHRRIVDRTLNRGPESVHDFSIKWVEVIEEMILFKPDFVIISAGFDAHDEDPLASCELTEQDFHWATGIVMEACVRMDPLNPAPVMSVLEGGYDLHALASSAVTHVEVLAAGYPVLLEGGHFHKNDSYHLEEVEGEGVEGEGVEGGEGAVEGVEGGGSGGRKARRGSGSRGHGGDEAAALAEFIAGLDI